jgi:ATP-dependent protease ClpP protease subunit
MPRDIKNISYKVSNSVSKNETDIEIYDTIGEYLDWATWEVKGVSYESFKNDLTRALESSNRINIKINSYGGSVNAGIAIYNLIQENSDKNIHVVITAAAYSAAMLIAQAVNKGNRHAYSNATGLVHEGMIEPWGAYNATQLREMAADLDKFNETIAISMSETMGISIESFKETYFDGKDHLMTAEEMLTAGLIDDIIPTANKANDNLDIVEKVANEIQKGFHKVAALFPNNKQNSKSTIMTLDQVYNTLSSDKELTAEERKAAADVVAKFNSAKYTQEEVDALISEKLTPLNEKIEEIEKENQELTSENEKLEQAIEEIKPGGTPSGADDSDDIPVVTAKRRLKIS